jgi:hypothetical protein
MNEIFLSNKCRLRLKNSTRWGSAFILLESLVTSEGKGCFDELESLVQ